jgi:hypothetical protein
LKITAREMSGRCAMFLIHECHDPRAGLGIWKKCCPAFGTLGWGQLPQDSVATDEVFLEKQEFYS